MLQLQKLFTTNTSFYKLIFRYLLLHVRFTFWCPFDVIVYCVTPFHDLKYYSVHSIHLCPVPHSYSLSFHLSRVERFLSLYIASTVFPSTFIGAGSLSQQQSCAVTCFPYSSAKVRLSYTF